MHNSNEGLISFDPAFVLKKTKQFQHRFDNFCSRLPTAIGSVQNNGKVAVSTIGITAWPRGQKPNRVVQSTSLATDWFCGEQHLGDNTERQVAMVIVLVANLSGNMTRLLIAVDAIKPLCLELNQGSVAEDDQ